MPSLRQLLVVHILLLSLARGAWADDYFLTIGGGASPANNQVSLEKNVRYLQRFITDARLSIARHDILFGSGVDEAGAAATRDIQFIDPSAKLPRANILLAKLFGGGDRLRHQYRPHDIPDLRGPANRKALDQWFNQVGARLTADDRVFIYFTGHGGRGSPGRNTTITLWNEAALPVRDFVAMLDKLPPGTRVVLVMVQCHAGGFADVIFKGGKNDGGLSDSNRCGFFATVPERQAAGCTPDIDEDNYREYSTHFWAALYGKTRLGDTIERPDYDHDGQVSLSEAHAYVQLISDTIDIPIASSDAFLRQYSRVKPSTPRNTKVEPDDPKGIDDELVTPELPFTKLMELATPAQRAVLDGLCAHLGIVGEERTKSIRAEAGKFDKARREAEQRRRGADRELSQVRNQIQSAIKLRWPELASPWHPEVARLLREEPEALVKAIESHASFLKLEQLSTRSSEHDTQARDAERKWVKCQRYLRVAENVALAANLPRVATKDIQQRHAKLHALENSALGNGIR